MSKKIIAQNRRARFEYHIEDSFEVGIVLQGSEVKTLRTGKISIEESYAAIENNEAWLINSYIAEYKEAGRFNHEPKRARKLLMHVKEIKKLTGKTQAKGYSLVPLSIYFNNRNIVKIELALVVGKKLHDKRATEKERDWQREKAAMLKKEF